MNPLDTRLRIATVVALVAGAIALGINVFALDRIEDQVIRNTKAVEKLQQIRGGGGGSSVTAIVGDCTPGESTGISQVGWGGAAAEVLCVQGRVEGAPYTLADKPKPQNDTYVNHRPSEPHTLNFFTTSEGDTRRIAAYTLQPMLDPDPDQPVLPRSRLATSWEVSPDHLTYTYHLRKGVQFADGRPFTSADVLFSYQVIGDPTVKADHLRGRFEDIASMTAPDDHTVVVKYKREYWKGLYVVGADLYVLNKGWYEDQIPKWAAKKDIEDFATEPGKPGFGEVFNAIRIPCPGTGPYYFALDDYTDGKVEFVQNPFYWGIQVEPEAWNFAKIKYRFISDDVAAFEAFRKQEFDVSVIAFDAWDDQYSKDPSVTSVGQYFEYDHTGIGWSLIAWNNRHPPFDDARVRRAMTHLLDRQAILDTKERGRGSIARYPTKPSYPSYGPDLPPKKLDVAKAKELLAEAGWNDTDGDGILDKNGKPFEWEFKFPSGGSYFVPLAERLNDGCKKVGIRMKMRPLEWATFVQDIDARRFDALAYYDGYTDPWVDPYEGFHSSQDVPNGQNVSGWRNKRVDELLEGMRKEFDDTRRNEMFFEFNRLFYDEQPMTLITHGLVGVLLNKRIKGGKVRPTGLRDFPMWVEPQDVLRP